MNKMAKNKNIMILMDNSNGMEFPLIIEDLIPVHNSPTKIKNEVKEPSREDFDRAVALIWMTLIEDSENSEVDTPSNSINIWEPKQVSDA